MRWLACSMGNSVPPSVLFKMFWSKHSCGTARGIASVVGVIIFRKGQRSCTAGRDVDLDLHSFLVLDPDLHSNC